MRRKRGLRVGRVTQEVHFESGVTVGEVAATRPPALAEIDAELRRIEGRLADPAVTADADRLTRVLAEQERWLDRYAEAGGPAHEGRVREWLVRLGFDLERLDQAADTLSGGQKKLLALVRAAVEMPDLLLLDEPDNHLDLRAKARLERFLRAYPGAFLVVSHDRYLLDDVVDGILELDGAVTVFHGGYSAYATERALLRLRQQKAWADQQKEIARIEASIARFEHWASLVVNERHIKQARSRRRKLDRMEERGEIIARPEAESRMALDFQSERGSRRALELRAVSAAFGEDPVFLDANLVVRQRERVGLVGPNGCGKSVLLRIVRGELAPIEGEVRVGPSTRVGWYAQEHERLAQWMQRTPLELVRDTQPQEEGKAIAFLRRFLFEVDQVRQPIAALSGGERSRLQLACLMLERPNLLLLDEPTNHLDIPSAEVLEEALDRFEGAVLVISHDRYFLDKVVDRVVDLSTGTLVSHAGGYTDFLETRTHEE